MVVVTTSITDQVHEECKKFGWSWSDLLELGYRTKVGMIKENKRITQIDESIEQMHQRLDKWIGKAQELQRKIWLLEELLGIDLNEMEELRKNESNTDQQI